MLDICLNTAELITRLYIVWLRYEIWREIDVFGTGIGGKVL